MLSCKEREFNWYIRFVVYSVPKNVLACTTPTSRMLEGNHTGPRGTYNQLQVAGRCPHDRDCGMMPYHVVLASHLH